MKKHIHTCINHTTLQEVLVILKKGHQHAFFGALSGIEDQDLIKRVLGSPKECKCWAAEPYQPLISTVLWALYRQGGVKPLMGAIRALDDIKVFQDVVELAFMFGRNECDDLFQEVAQMGLLQEFLVKHQERCQKIWERCYDPDDEWFYEKNLKWAEAYLIALQ